MERRSTDDLNVLPEGCISNILSLTSPSDACRSSVVSSVFRSAADSNSVWERFLPSDIHRSFLHQCLRLCRLSRPRRSSFSISAIIPFLSTTALRPSHWRNSVGRSVI
ncbi:hypothetical protein NE237_013950 [Protea cynaroides]|uniref:F-box domain-containing protein n=1 Tax=Protea cynaroides TaxID=273540 RepID=A0A9Q0JZG4_9MAGN|nr:hypothetical protein NE237_013950 [Protea cynaroides]